MKTKTKITRLIILKEHCPFEGKTKTIAIVLTLRTHCIFLGFYASALLGAIRFGWMLTHQNLQMMQSITSSRLSRSKTYFLAITIVM